MYLLYISIFFSSLRHFRLFIYVNRKISGETVKRLKRSLTKMFQSSFRHSLCLIKIFQIYIWLSLGQIKIFRFSFRNIIIVLLIFRYSFRHLQNVILYSVFYFQQLKSKFQQLRSDISPLWISVYALNCRLVNTKSNIEAIAAQ